MGSFILSPSTLVVVRWENSGKSDVKAMSALRNLYAPGTFPVDKGIEKCFY